MKYKILVVGKINACRLDVEFHKVIILKLNFKKSLDLRIQV